MLSDFLSEFIPEKGPLVVFFLASFYFSPIQRTTSPSF